MLSTFDILDREAQALCEATFGIAAGAEPAPAIVYHPMRERPSAAPAVDPDRPVTVIPDAIVSQAAARVNLGDNGMGRLSGKNNLSVASDRLALGFAKTALPFQPLRQDEVTIDAARYRVTEVLDDGGAAWSLMLNGTR
jgi:hypothetical protein